MCHPILYYINIQTNICSQIVSKPHTPKFIRKVKNVNIFVNFSISAATACHGLFWEAESIWSRKPLFFKKVIFTKVGYNKEALAILVIYVIFGSMIQKTVTRANLVCGHLCEKCGQ